MCVCLNFFENKIYPKSDFQQFASAPGIVLFCRITLGIEFLTQEPKNCKIRSVFYHVHFFPPQSPVWCGFCTRVQFRISLVVNYKSAWVDHFISDVY